jgi:hypothetical protein
VNTTQQKYMLILKTLYNPEAGRQEKESASKAIHELTETQQVDFNNFQHYVGEIFLKVKEELDQGLEELADRFPDETDPREWDMDDWAKVVAAISGHKYEEIYWTYANQQPNIHLIWAEIEKRL